MTMCDYKDSFKFTWYNSIFCNCVLIDLVLDWQRG